MYERILIPLDGSSEAEVALPYAEEVAAKLGAEIILVGVYDPTAAGMGHLYRSYIEHIGGKVQRQLMEMGAPKGAEVKGEVLVGNPVSEIVRYADESNVSLIAMARRGRSGRGPGLLRAIATRVLQATGKPVLLIRAPASSAALEQRKLVRRILAPLDGSKVGETAIPHAEALARVLGAELVLFHVVEPVSVWVDDVVPAVPWAVAQEEEGRRRARSTAYLEGMAKALQERGLSTSSAVSSGPAATRIMDYAEANAIDLIAMSTHGRSGIGRWVFGSITHKVLHIGDTAVLVVRATTPES